MLNRFHPVYHTYTYLAGSRVDVERVLESELDREDPEEVIDQFSEPPQYFERLSPVTTTIGETEVKGRNWTDMTIQCYRLFGKIFLRATAFLRQALRNNYGEKTMVPFMSMAVDPDTLERLIEYDYEAGETSYTKLVELFESGAVAPAVTTPFHSILPLLPSDFDRRLCVRLGLMFFAPVLRAYERYLKGIGEDQLVVSFWTPEGVVSPGVLQIIQEEFFSFCLAEKFRKPHLVFLLDADLAVGHSLDRLMKLWYMPEQVGKRKKNVTVVFRDPAFSSWMMESHPSIKKIIDRTIAKVDANLADEDVDYTWSHFESLEALTHSPRDAVSYEQRILKLCELGYLSVSPDTYVRRKLNGRFGVASNEPLAVALEDRLPEKDRVGERSHYGRWRGWALGAKGTPAVMANRLYLRKLPKGSEKRQGSPCWKIAWSLTRDACFRTLGGDPKRMTGGMLGVLAKLTGVKNKEGVRKNVERFLVEYGLIYWREHFIQHDLSEADIRLDETVERTLRKGTKKKPTLEQVVAAGCAAQAYYFMLDSCNSYGLEAENLDQRAMFQNAMMLTLAFCNGVAVCHYLGDTRKAKALADTLEEYLIGFRGAYDRFDLVSYGVSKQAWNKALESEIPESKANVIERAARRTAARHLAEFGYEERFDPDDEELTTNTGHQWSREASNPNYRWANPYYCGVREA